jgi:hypothetical protein
MIYVILLSARLIFECPIIAVVQAFEDFCRD